MVTLRKALILILGLAMSLHLGKRTDDRMHGVAKPVESDNIDFRIYGVYTGIISMLNPT